jgi:hypothetical protein
MGIPMKISAEYLVYWYLRLKGFLTIRNFIIHTVWKRDSPTDADTFGVHFPYRKELHRRPLEDDKWIQPYSEGLLLIIAEVKTGLCNINGPWTNPCRRNVNKILSAIGLFSETRVDTVAQDLYQRGVHRTDGQVTLLVAFGIRENTELSKDRPEVKQILYSTVWDFIYNRFSTYLQEKSWHQPWDCVGEALFKLAKDCRNAASFAESIRHAPQCDKRDGNSLD